jgi:hypothetical protein
VLFLFLIKEGERDLKLGDILREQQPELYKLFNCRRENKNLSFSDYKNMMKHSSYKRVQGAIRQVK